MVGDGVLETAGFSIDMYNMPKQLETMGAHNKVCQS